MTSMNAPAQKFNLDTLNIDRATSTLVALVYTIAQDDVQAFAPRLIEELAGNGIQVRDLANELLSHQESRGPQWREGMRAAIVSSDGLLIIAGPRYSGFASSPTDKSSPELAVDAAQAAGVPVVCLLS